MTDTATIELTAHLTSAGKVSLAATDGRLTHRKYTVGGYRFYAVRARHVASSWDSRTKTFVESPAIAINVIKRSKKNRDVVEREARLRGDFLVEIRGDAEPVVLAVSKYGARL